MGCTEVRCSLRAAAATKEERKNERSVSTYRCLNRLSADLLCPASACGVCVFAWYASYSRQQSPARRIRGQAGSMDLTLPHGSAHPSSSFHRVCKMSASLSGCQHHTYHWEHTRTCYDHPYSSYVPHPVQNESDDTDEGHNLSIQN